MSLARSVEAWLEQERTQLPLWAPIALGAGICAWFALPSPRQWLAWVLFWSLLALVAWVAGRNWRTGAFVAIGSALLAGGCLLPWAKAVFVGAPPLARPAMASFEAEVRGVEQLAARNSIRLKLAPRARPDLPPIVRVTVSPDKIDASVAPGTVVALRAYLLPPPPEMLPGGYNYAMRAWFDGIGGTGRALGDVRIIQPSETGHSLRQQLGAHIGSQLSGGAGAIATALATGDQGVISEADAEAMRRSGLAHLLSISGLHVSALIGGVIIVVMRLLALSPRLALHVPLLLIAAACGAAAGIGYTLLTGAQVPTVRSCIAALLVIGGLAMGRDAISLRLVASGALIVMIFWPEAVIGPSFQMSFGAVVSIIALYEYPPTRRLFARREEEWSKRIIRILGALLASGLAVELVLAPIAIFHFHRAGLLGSLANMIAIPLTSFIIMPAELAALILDLVGLGYPAWLITGAALNFLLGLAHWVAALPYAIVPVPGISGPLFAATMLGLLWLMLWKGRVRWLGLAVACTGLVLIARTQPPDMLVSRDGRHVALRMANGEIGLLRARTGDYIRQSFAETMGVDGELDGLDGLDGARCSKEACLVEMPQPDGEPIRILATRSSAFLEWDAFIRACTQADIVVSDRRLPDACTPRWLKLDRTVLNLYGGIAAYFPDRRIMTSRDPNDRHPWIARPAPARRVPVMSTTHTNKAQEAVTAAGKPASLTN